MHIETANLKRAFESVRHLPEGGSKLVPFFSNVRFYTPEGGRLILTARDDAMEATDALPCEGEALDICLPANRIAAVLMAAGDSVSIERKDEKAIVKSGRSRHTIACMPGAEMVTISLEGEPRVKVKAPGIGQALASVYWAAAKDRVDIPAVNGVQIDVGDESVTTTATTGGMIATNRCDVESVSGPEKAFQEVISVKAAQRVIALAPEYVEARPGSLRFLRGDRALTVKTFASKYPDWRGLFPAPFGAIKVKRKEFFLAVNTAASYDDAKVTEKDKMRSVRLKSDGKTLIIYSPGEAEGCRYEIEIDGCAVESDYRALDLVRGLAQGDAEEVELLFAKSGGMAFLRINDGDWRFLAAPMKV